MYTWIEIAWIFVEDFEMLGHVQVLQWIPARFDPIGIARNDRLIRFTVPNVTHDDQLFEFELAHSGYPNRPTPSARLC